MQSLFKQANKWTKNFHWQVMPDQQLVSDRRVGWIKQQLSATLIPLIPTESIPPGQHFSAAAENGKASKILL